MAPLRNTDVCYMSANRTAQAGIGRMRGILREGKRGKTISREEDKLFKKNSFDLSQFTGNIPDCKTSYKRPLQKAAFVLPWHFQKCWHLLTIKMKLTYFFLIVSESLVALVFNISVEGCECNHLLQVKTALWERERERDRERARAILY